MPESTELHLAAEAGDLLAVKALLENDSVPNIFDDIGFTPLHYAAREGHLDVIKELLKSKADINARDESRLGNTPLGEIAGYCTFAIAQLLIERGADPTIKGWMQLSAIDRARGRKKREGSSVYQLLRRSR